MTRARAGGRPSLAGAEPGACVAAAGDDLIEDDPFRAHARRTGPTRLPAGGSIVDFWGAGFAVASGWVYDLLRGMRVTPFARAASSAGMAASRDDLRDCIVSLEDQGDQVRVAFEHGPPQPGLEDLSVLFVGSHRW
jgi:hypothetical protein